ncbi:hypothetical protein ATANTOWER_028175 [Ataeniobius toweri]|uniref:Myb-like domain-containing protein n=1 Tax=Ataeniobius toweri TaxID=208326 RepID=A0ABU7AI52_9TELE|nr:hypothetical protein [Ataeniobius toweri]
MSGHLLRIKDIDYNSPAKVFAKLKAEVQKEAESKNEMIFNVREQRGDRVKTGYNLKTGGVYTADGPRLYQNPAGFCWGEEVKENSRFASHQTEAEVLTLSPIPSPEKTFDSPGYAPLQEEVPLSDTVRGFTRRNRAHMESTAVSQPLFGVYRGQIHAVTPQITDSFSRIQPTESCRRSIFNKKSVPLNLRSPIGVYSPMKKRPRKCKLDPNDSEEAFRTTEESNEESGPPQARRKPAVIGGSTQNNTWRQDRFNVKGFPSDRPEPKFQESESSGLQSPVVVLERIPIMSPAKLFAWMKETEGNLKESRDTDVSTNHCMEHTKDIPLMNTPKQAAPVNRNRAESPENQSDTSVAALIPPSPPPTVSLEDALVLNTPHISIPKKDKPVFRRNVRHKQRNFSFESVIHLGKWFLRRNRQGLFVDGIHKDENIQWNSNVITERISSSVLRTVSGRVYVLLGRMNIKLANDFPMWFLKKFENGFPSNWKKLYETFLSESKEQAKKNKETIILAKNESELPSSNESVRKRRIRSAKTPESYPPSCSSINVSRSGRVIKPPLEYWKGGRVILDAHMNVTIYKSYETSSPDLLKDACQKTSKKPVHVFLPHSNSLNQQESEKDEWCSVPVRRVKANRKLDRAEVNRDHRSTDSSIEMISSPSEVSGKTRSKRQCPGAERRLRSNAGPLKQERSSSQRSKKQGQNTSRPLRTSESDKKSPESSFIDDKTSNHLLTRRRGKAGRGTKGMAVFSKSEPGHRVSPNRSPAAVKKNRKWQTKKSRAARKSDVVREDKKESKRTQPAPPAKPSTWATHPDRKHLRNKGSAAVPHERDGDEWTEDEILKLQGAVSRYPKHIAGYWAKVARTVGTRSAEECHKQHTCQGTTQSPAKSAKDLKKEKEKAVKPAEPPVISARVGTLKRKQQVRQFLKTVPKEDVDDAFSSAYMQNKRIEIPFLGSTEDHDFAMSVMEPQTPKSLCFPEAKTPQCLHITPGMIGSPNTNNDDKYVYKLQKRMKKNQFNVCKTSSSLKKYTPTSSAKQTVRRCGNTESDTFFLLEMLPENNDMFDSDEEEDFYFSDN